MRPRPHARRSPAGGELLLGGGVTRLLRAEQHHSREQQGAGAPDPAGSLRRCRLQPSCPSDAQAERERRCRTSARITQAERATACAISSVPVARSISGQAVASPPSSNAGGSRVPAASAASRASTFASSTSPRAPGPGQRRHPAASPQGSSGATAKWRRPRARRPRDQIAAGSLTVRAAGERRERILERFGGGDRPRVLRADRAAQQQPPPGHSGDPAALHGSSSSTAATTLAASAGVRSLPRARVALASRSPRARIARAWCAAARGAARAVRPPAARPPRRPAPAGWRAGLRRLARAPSPARARARQRFTVGAGVSSSPNRNPTSPASSSPGDGTATTDAAAPGGGDTLRSLSSSWLRALIAGRPRGNTASSWLDSEPFAETARSGPRVCARVVRGHEDRPRSAPGRRATASGVACDYGRGVASVDAFSLSAERPVLTHLVTNV